MKHSPHRSAELHLTLDRGHSDLVRAFVREASLAEEVPIAVAGQIAEDSVQAWLGLCPSDAGRDRARIALSCSRGEVSSRILLCGHARFAAGVAALGGRIPPDASISSRERGIDGWEIGLHRNLRPIVEPLQDTAFAPAAPLESEQADECVVDVPQKSDAPAIARCFLEIYGRHYVHAEVFSPRRYWDKVESGELIPAVARDGRGEVVGHVALERDPGARVAERGEAVVLPAYRGHHLLERMTARLSDEAAKRDLLGVYSEALTIHTFSQRNEARAGLSVCAALLGANPESFRPQDVPCPTAGQRQSYLRAFRFVQTPSARTVYAPAPYRETLLKLYARLGVPVSMAVASTSHGQSRTGIKVNARGYGMIAFEQIGEQAAVELRQALRDVRALGAAAVQLSAPIGDPGLPLLTEAARALGFFFCGLGPAFAEGEDTFLLQWLGEPLDVGKLQLFGDEAKELVAFVERDRAATAPKA